MNVVSKLKFMASETWMVTESSRTVMKGQSQTLPGGNGENYTFVSRHTIGVRLPPPHQPARQKRNEGEEITQSGCTKDKGGIGKEEVEMKRGSGT